MRIATFYDPNTGNQGACGGFIGTNDWVVAINTDQYAGGKMLSEASRKFL